MYVGTDCTAPCQKSPGSKPCLDSPDFDLAPECDVWESKSVQMD